MNRKIVYIILGALAVLAVIFFLWFWLFNKASTPNINTGNLGTAPTKTSTGVGTAGSGNNAQSSFGDSGGSGGGGSATNIQTPIVPTYTGEVGTTLTDSGTPIITISDATWLDGSAGGSSGSTGGGGSGGGGAGRIFTPTPINQLNNVTISGTGYFLNPNNSSTGGAPPGYGNLFGAGVAGAIACVPGLLGGGAGALVGFLTGFPVNSIAQNVEAGDKIYKDFLGCIARTIARVAIQKITADVVDWINSGFEGKPAFVQNYKQFFNSVADEAAGEFIQGSALSFLCSPFQLQIKIAIAQSYARRSSAASAPSCTLSQVTDNIQGFLDGDFAKGGWPAFLSLTNEPTNNPYGAYMYGEIAINNKVIASTQEAASRISPEGFLAQTKTVCTGPLDLKTGKRTNCTTVVETPGSVIAATLNKTIGGNLDSLNLADNFDEIIGALVNQLIQRTLVQGLSNLSGGSGYASTFTNPINQQATKAAEDLLTKLQAAVQLAQQFGSAKQGAIGDLQNTQNQLTTLYNCWSAIASSTSATTQQQTQATVGAYNANAQLKNLETRVGTYNAQITKANYAIARVQQLQTNALSATSLAEVQTVSAQFTTAQTNNVLMTLADVIAAQQDRSTLQNEMETINQNTATQLNQCYALGQ